METCNATELSARLQSDAPPVLIDVMPEERFRAARIPGAANACVYVVSFLDDVAGAVADPGTAVVVYGSGPRSLASADAAAKLRRAGYADVTDFRGGLEEWSAAGLPVEGEGEPAPEAEPAGAETLPVDREKSRLRWVGRNLAGRHEGEIGISGGEVVLADGRLAGGRVVVDMRTITCADIEDPGLNGVLIRHLESDDFFDVELYPEAVFEIESAEPIPDAPPGRPDVTCRGTLTMKGVTAPVEFEAATGRTADGGFAAQAQLAIDRTTWGVNYGSGRLYDFLGMHLVNDHVSLDLTVMAAPVAPPA